jgi:hypothetical protein
MANGTAYVRLWVTLFAFGCTRIVTPVLLMAQAMVTRVQCKMSII